jgi:hypothetical protein
LTTQEYITYVPAVTGDYEFSSGEFYATASVNTGGTSGAPKSTLYGINPNVQLGSGATNWVEIIGEELDIAVNTGASVNSLIGLEIGLSPNHAVRGTQDDVGLLISGSQQAVGLTVGIALGTPGKPTAFDSLSTLIRASPGVVNPSGLTVTNGIDFGSGMTFTGNTWNDGHIIFTGSGGIRVNGSSGVSCSGSPTSGFLSVNGIVTHC